MFAIFIALFVFLGNISQVSAAPGINEQINFQGRLLNIAGATVPDGYYNVQFKIYQNGDGQTANNPSGTLLWTESYLNDSSNGVRVVNGYISVQLGSLTPFGSSIDWDQNTLWLSINVGNTSTSCATFSSCSPDGEMLPMKRLSATPYSLNSGRLNGLTSDKFLQIAQGVQDDATTNTSSIYLNKTGTGGNFARFQSAGSDALLIDNNGDLSFGASADHSISIATSTTDTAGRELSITAGSGGNGTGSLGGTLTLQGGAAGGTNGNGGDIVINAGAATGTGTDGTISIGGDSTSAISLGNTDVGTLVNIQGGSGTGGVNIGTEGTSGTSIDLYGQTTIATQGTNQTNALRVQNADDQAVLSVNTVNGTVNVGEANALNGTLIFRSASGGNYVALGLATSPNSSYTLLLPNTAPAGGLCLKSGAENPNQLAFGDCLTPSTPKFVQQTTNTSGSSVTNLTTAIQNAGAGNLLVALIATNKTSAVVTSVTDSSSNTWSKAVSRSSSNGTTIEIWYCAGVSPTNSVSVHTSSGSYISAHISEFEGTANVSVLDVSSGNTNIGGTDFRTGSVTTTVANDLIIGATGWVNGPSISADSDGWNDFSSIAGTSSIRALSARYTVGADTAPYSTGWTTSWYTTGATAIAAFKPVGEGGSDYAEMYGTSDASIEAGDVVALDETRSAQRITNSDGQDDSKAWVKKATNTKKNSVLGIVSTAPAKTIGNTYTGADNPRPIALSGRVPIKVSTENGNIEAGDYLVISSKDGIAMKATSAGMTVGQAMSSFSGNGIGQVTAFVNVTYFPGIVEGSTLTLSGDEPTLIPIEGVESAEVVSSPTDDILQPTDNKDLSTIDGSLVQQQEGLSILTENRANSSIAIGEGTASLAASGLGDLYIAGNLEVRTALRVGDEANGITLFAGQAPSSTNGFYRGSSRPTETISLAPAFAGVTTTGEEAGLLTTGFDATPGNTHSYYDWTSQNNDELRMYVRIPIPRNWSSFTSNPSICYQVWTSSPSTTSIKSTFYDTTGSAQATDTLTPDSPLWTEKCSRNVGGSITVNGKSFATVRIDLSASAGSHVRIGELSLDYLSAF